jgi:hypothetical protein
MDSVNSRKVLPQTCWPDYTSNQYLFLKDVHHTTHYEMECTY